MQQASELDDKAGCCRCKNDKFSLHSRDKPKPKANIPLNGVAEEINTTHIKGAARGRLALLAADALELAKARWDLGGCDALCFSFTGPI